MLPRGRFGPLARLRPQPRQAGRWPPHPIFAAGFIKSAVTRTHAPSAQQWASSVGSPGHLYITGCPKCKPHSAHG
eukprot:90503-Alexandrium_andersonii.AAC.1